MHTFLFFFHLIYAKMVMSLRWLLSQGLWLFSFSRSRNLLYSTKYSSKIIVFFFIIVFIVFIGIFKKIPSVPLLFFSFFKFKLLLFYTSFIIFILLFLLWYYGSLSSFSFYIVSLTKVYKVLSSPFCWFVTSTIWW